MSLNSYLIDNNGRPFSCSPLEDNIAAIFPEVHGRSHCIGCQLYSRTAVNGAMGGVSFSQLHASSLWADQCTL